MRKLIAATIVLASVLASIFALVPAYTTWAETLPHDVAFLLARVTPRAGRFLVGGQGGIP